MANKKKHINVTVGYEQNKERLTNLRIPVKITVQQLIRELNQIFNVVDFDYKYQIKITNKGLLLDERHNLKDYPVTDGDIMMILEENRDE